MTSYEHVYIIPVCKIQTNFLLRTLVQYRITQHLEIGKGIPSPFRILHTEYSL